MGAGHIHKGNERASPCNYLPTWQSHLVFASDCDPSFSPRRPGFVLHPGLTGGWGVVAVFPPPPPPGCLLSLMGLLIQVVPVAAQTHGLCSGGRSGAWGVWVLGCGSLRGVLFPPLLPWPCTGLVFSCSLEICQICHHSFTSFLTHILHAGAAARCVDYSFT